MFICKTFTAGCLLAAAGPLFAQVAEGLSGPTLSLGILGSAQSETLAYRQMTTGFKVLADVQWHNWIGFDARGTAISFTGSDHTYAFEAGPRMTHTYGPFIPYAEALAGGIHQYYYGATVGGVVGTQLHVYRNVYSSTEGEYRYAPQHSTPLVNPREGRVELSTGIEVLIGDR